MALFPKENVFSQNILKIISIIEEDSSFIKGEYNLKTYYLLSPKRLHIATYKIMQYDNQRELLFNMKIKSSKDSNIITDKDKSILLLNNLSYKYEKDKKDLQDDIFMKEKKITKKNAFIAYLITALTIETTTIFLLLKK